MFNDHLVRNENNTVCKFYTGFRADTLPQASATTYRLKEVDMPRPLIYETASDFYFWKISILVHAVLRATNFAPVSAVSSAAQAILSEKKFSDFQILSGDGTVIPCHKAFLTGKLLLG